MINKRYFGACNSAKGFDCRFDDLFFDSRIKTRYIIKGGPGTGKSTFMKRIADYADRLGHDVELYYCSADTGSVDGVIICDTGVCIFDGTAPHAYDGIYPGAVDKTVYMNRFWDERKLEDNKHGIAYLFAAAADENASGYKLLKAAGNIAENLFYSSKPHLLTEKLSKSAANYSARFASGKRRVKTRFVTSISGDGVCTMPYAFSDAVRVYLVQGKYTVAPVFLAELSRKADAEITVCPLPLLPDMCEAVYFERDRVLFTSNPCLSYGKRTSVIHASRYWNALYFSENRAKLSFEQKCVSELVDHACSYFSMAKFAHSELENIYVSSMDFSAKEKFTDDFIRLLFGTAEASF